MPVETVERYTRQMLRDRPEALFVFDDNLARTGRGGLAALCRDEPNAVGIPTKFSPTMKETAFFRDKDFEAVKGVIDMSFGILVAHLKEGGAVVVPANGIGTGLAQLADRAPAIQGYIALKLRLLQEIA